MIKALDLTANLTLTLTLSNHLKWFGTIVFGCVHVPVCPSVCVKTLFKHLAATSQEIDSHTTYKQINLCFVPGNSKFIRPN